MFGLRKFMLTGVCLSLPSSVSTTPLSKLEENLYDKLFYFLFCSSCLIECWLAKTTHHRGLGGQEDLLAEEVLIVCFVGSLQDC